MEQEIENWQAMWQEKKATTVAIDSLINGLNTVEKQSKKERIAMFIAFPVTIFVLLLLLPVFTSFYYLVSAVLIAIAMLLIIVKAYISKFKKVAYQETFSNKKFIESHIKKLKDRMKITSKYMWMYAFLLIVAINIGYVEALKYASFTFRIFMHLGFSIILLLLFKIGIKLKMKQYQQEILPLIEMLIKIEK